MNNTVFSFHEKLISVNLVKIVRLYIWSQFPSFSFSFLGYDQVKMHFLKIALMMSLNICCTLINHYYGLLIANVWHLPQLSLDYCFCHFDDNINNINVNHREIVQLCCPIHDTYDVSIRCYLYAVVLYNIIIIVLILKFILIMKCRVVLGARVVIDNDYNDDNICVISWSVVVWGH